MADTVLYAPFFQGEDANGNPLAGAKLYFYLANTTTKITIYQDGAAATPHQNPVVADSAGMFPPIFLAAGQALFKTELTTSAGSVIQTADGISSVQRYSATFADLIAKWTPASASGPASLDFPEDTDNGTSKARLIGQASLAADITVTLPATTGTLALLTTLLDAIDGLTPAAGGFLRFDSSTTAAMAAIVGTVSQSGGTPTGAIIETGSNANGRYIRYADGTLICAFEIATGSRVFAGAGTYADPYRSNSVNWTFPSVFSASPTVVLSPRVDFPSNGIRRASTAAYSSISTTTLTGVQCYMTASPSDVADTYATMVAVGRWF